MADPVNDDARRPAKGKGALLGGGALLLVAGALVAGLVFDAATARRYDLFHDPLLVPLAVWVGLPLFLSFAAALTPPLLRQFRRDAELRTPTPSPRSVSATAFTVGLVLALVAAALTTRYGGIWALDALDRLGAPRPVLLEGVVREHRARKVGLDNHAERSRRGRDPSHDHSMLVDLRGGGVEEIELPWSEAARLPPGTEVRVRLQRGLLGLRRWPEYPRITVDPAGGTGPR
jgi:hypothetical protein